MPPAVSPTPVLIGCLVTIILLLVLIIFLILWCQFACKVLEKVGPAPLPWIGSERSKWVGQLLFFYLRLRFSFHSLSLSICLSICLSVYLSDCLPARLSCQALERFYEAVMQAILRHINFDGQSDT